MAQFQCDIDIYTTADSGPRDPRKCQFWCLHTTENDDSTPPDNVAKWQQNRANGSSYNILVGTSGRTVRSNDDNYIPWSAGTVGNERGLHLAFVGRANRSRAEWLAQMVQLRSAARVVASWVREYGLPNEKLSSGQLGAGKRGGCGHADVNTVWSSGAFRSDPGPHFPWDVFLNLVGQELTGSAPPPVIVVPPPANGLVTTYEGGQLVTTGLPVEGKISWFGGGGDQSTIKGYMALSGEPGATPADPWYCAMRWSYCQWEPYQERGEWWLRPVAGTSNLEQKRSLNGLKILVTHKGTGKRVVLRAADTGPRPAARVVDVSPHALHDILGGDTGDDVFVALAPADVPLGPYNPTEAPPTPPPPPGPAPRQPIPDPGTVEGRVRDLWWQSMGVDGRRWPQLADMTLVDAIATIGSKLGIEGFEDMRNR